MLPPKAVTLLGLSLREDAALKPVSPEKLDGRSQASQAAATTSTRGQA